jgi:hypothetical protein
MAGSTFTRKKANGELVLARTILAEPRLAGLIPSAAFPFFLPHFVFPTLNSIAITPDSKQIAASGIRSLSSTIALWDLADGSNNYSDKKSESIQTDSLTRR